VFVHVQNSSYSEWLSSENIFARGLNKFEKNMFLSQDIEKNMFLSQDIQGTQLLSIAILKILCLLQGIFFVINHLLLCHVALQFCLQSEIIVSFYGNERSKVCSEIQEQEMRRCALYVPNSFSSIFF